MCSCLSWVFSARMHKREDQVSQLIYHIEKFHPGDLCGYNGTDVDYILELLESKDACERLAQNQTLAHNGTYIDRTIDLQDANGAVVRMSNNSHHVVAMETTPRAKDHDNPRDHPNSDARQYKTQHDAKPGRNHAHRNVTKRHSRRASGPGRASSASRSDAQGEVHRKVDFHEEHDSLREIAHGLHFASIAILAFLVLEVSKVWGKH